MFEGIIFHITGAGGIKGGGKLMRLSGNEVGV